MSATESFLIVCHDAPGAVAKRQALLQEHLDYCIAIESRYQVAGVLLADDQESVAGSAMVVQATDRADAMRVVTDDPYYPAGVWARVEVMPYLIAFGNLRPPALDPGMAVPGYEDR